MSDEFPRDLGELDARISADMLAAAMQGVRDAERYALARECDPEPPPAHRQSRVARARRRHPVPRVGG
jgi:hypothetical protein